MSSRPGRHRPEYSQWELTAPWIGLFITIGWLSLLFGLLAADFYVNQPQGPDVYAAAICAVAAIGSLVLAVIVLQRGLQSRSSRTSFDRKTPFAVLVCGLVFALGGYLASAGTAAVMVTPWLVFASGGLLLAAYGCYLLVLNRRHYWRKSTG